MINCSRYGLIQRAADDSIPALIPAIALLATRHTEHQGQGPGRHPLKVGALLRWWRSRALYAAGGGHFRLHIGLYRLICAVLYGLVYVVLWGPTGSASLLSKGAATMTRTRLGRLRRHRTSHAHAHDVTEVRQVHLHAVRHTLALIMHRAGIAPADAAALLCPIQPSARWLRQGKVLNCRFGPKSNRHAHSSLLARRRLKLVSSSLLANAVLNCSLRSRGVFPHRSSDHQRAPTDSRREQFEVPVSD
jgi:hypothetical protein